MKTFIHSINKELPADWHGPKVLRAVFLAALLLCSAGNGFAAVTITAPSLTVCATPTFPTNYYTLTNIVITEGANADFSVGTNVTLILTVPTNFEFQAGVGSVTYAGAANITAASISVTTTTITVTITVGGTNKADVLTISGIKVMGINSITGASNITRTGGTATISGNDNGTVHGTLTSSSTTAPTAPNVSRCGTGTVNLSASGGGGTSYLWYDASTGGNFLNIGANFTTPSISTTTPYYVSCATLAAETNLSSGLTGGNALTANSFITFNVTNNNSGTIVVTQLSTRVNVGSTSVSFQVYYRVGTAIGFEASSSGWTQLGGPYNVVTAPLGTPTIIDVTDLAIPSGQLTGIYIFVNHQMVFLNGTASTASDANIAYSGGSCQGTATLLATAGIAGHGWQGAVYYRVASSCESARTTCQAIIATAIIANAGTDQEVCASAILAGNSPVVGTGTWSVIAGSGTFSPDANTPNATVNGLSTGLNTFRWTFSDCNASFDDVDINNPPTSISVQPANAVACAGAGTALFTVTATGSGLTYQWQEYISGWLPLSNGGVYSGVTTATLTITNPPIGMNGYKYRCVVNGTCGNATSNGNATLTVTAPVLTIDAHPSDATVCQNTNVNFSVTAAGSVFQWQINTGSGWNNINVAGSSPTYSNWTTNTLSLTGTDNPSGYQYRCLVGCNQLASNAATLTIIPPSDPTPTGASRCGTGTLTLSATGAIAGEVYKWYDAITGGTLLKTSVDNTDNTYITPSISVTTNYYVTIFRTAGGCESYPRTLVVATINTPVSITVQPPASQTFCTGNPATISVTATGTGLLYQWRKGGTPLSDGGTISGSGTATLSINPAYPSDNGNYDVIVSGVCTPSQTSISSSLTIIPTQSDAGPDQMIMGTTATLAGNNPTAGSGLWTKISGLGSITNNTLYNSGVTGISAAGVSVFVWTITLGSCVSTDTVRIIQHCTPTGSGNAIYITNVIFNTINRNSSAAWESPGYVNTGLSTTIARDLSYDLTVSYRNATGSTYTLYTSAWIDWNNDGDFADGGETVMASTGASVAGSTTVNRVQSVSVPSNAFIGSTRMRVAVQYGSPYLPDACSSNLNDEWEDYYVNIVSSHCFNGIQDADETGVDCGGADCVGCGGTCFDGIWNNGETNIDCGGPCALSCTPQTNITSTTSCSGSAQANIYPINCDQIGTSAYGLSGPNATFTNGSATDPTVAPGCSYSSPMSGDSWIHVNLEPGVSQFQMQFIGGSMATGNSTCWVAAYQGTCASLTYIGCQAAESFISSIYAVYNVLFAGLDPNQDLWLYMWNDNNKAYNLTFNTVGAGTAPSNISCAAAAPASGGGCNLAAPGASFTTPGDAGVSCTGGNWGSNENTTFYSFVPTATIATLTISDIICNDGTNGQAQFGVWTSCAAIGTYGANFLGCAVGTSSINLTGLTIGQTYYIAADGYAGDNCVWNFSGTGILLPVELLRFKAVPQTNYVKLYWLTASEINNDYFTIERCHEECFSNEYEYWEIVATVDGAGTSNHPIEYSSYDYDPYPGISYYRLKQTDYDGASEYSAPVAVEFNNKNLQSVNIYPNPNDGSFFISLKGYNVNENVHLVLTTSIGSVVYSANVVTEDNGDYLGMFKPEFHLSKGVYLLEISTLRSLSNEKIIVR